MKRRLVLILALMSACVAGIIALQLFWNYQNYHSTVRTFTHDVNDALTIAAHREINTRHQTIIRKFKHWLSDTSFIAITCDNLNRYKETVFHMRDVHPLHGDSRPVSIGINSFKESLTEITPEAKAIFIDHFADNILAGDLRKGIVYFYTQRLGDSLSIAYERNKVNLDTLDAYYQTALRQKGVNASFKFNSPDTTETFITQKVNTALRDPYQKELVYASFVTPNAYFLKEMKWVIGSTLLLIGITLFCFGYTVNTLLSQQKLAELKDNFVNNMTHELNTPLAAIRVTADALLTLKHTPETQRDYLEIISHQTEKLSQLTSHILNTNRLALQEKKRQLVDLHHLIERVLHHLAPQLNEQRAVITYNKSTEVIYLKASDEELTNAFINIIDNALKYSPGILQLTITVLKKNDHAEVSFADNGIGIPAGYREKVFDQFFRVPQGNTHTIKGYGLGLSYVRQVMTKHKGTVSVSVNEAGGSIFILYLPL